MGLLIAPPWNQGEMVAARGRPKSKVALFGIVRHRVIGYSGGDALKDLLSYEVQGFAYRVIFI
jgi:hypothetical protein